jgi:hypothetical protein
VRKISSTVIVLALGSFLSACAVGEVGAGRESVGGTAGGGGTIVGSPGPAGQIVIGATGGSGTAGIGAGGTTDLPGAAGAAGAGAAGASGCTADGVPADVASFLSLRCLACHGATPIAGVPASFATYASITAPSKTDPTKSNAALALVRVQAATMPMPPAPLARATSAEIAVLSAWVAAGTPKADCSAAADGGVTPDAGPIAPLFDPFAVAAKCSSATKWTSGNKGSADMNPGLACIGCHAMGGDGPRYTIAGTLYPTGHEPDLCDGVSPTSAAGAQIVIVGMDQKSVTIPVNAAGNFFWTGTLAKPYLAKVVYMGRERAMIESQTSGDCNTCHTQNGTMLAGATMKAPGRIVLP